MKILSLAKQGKAVILRKTLEALQNGKLVVFPSDTVYGLLADATNKYAVRKLISFKERPAGKPISVFVANFAMLKDVVTVEKETSERLKKLLPGPFTIVLPSTGKVSTYLESELGTLGVRLPDYLLITDLVGRFNKPVTATSANLSNRSPNYSIESFLHQLPSSKQASLDIVIDAGHLPRNKPSTVIDMTQERVKVLREGDVKINTEITHFSPSPENTMKIATSTAKSLLKGKREKPLIFILKGELGAGKTVFVKGVAAALGIIQISSPTFVIYYEYSIPQRKGNFFVHLDLYNIHDDAEFKELKIERYLEKGNVLCFEWGEKSGAILNSLRRKGRVVFIEISYINENRREIKIQY